MEPVAIVTGGVRGIGRAVALDLLDKGWRVAVCYRTSSADAESFLAYARSRQQSAIALQQDIADPAEAQQLVDDVLSRWGRVDALINGVGPLRRIDLLEETPAGWREMIGGNLDSVFFMTRLAAESMIQRQSGRVVNFGIANADHISAQPQIAGHAIAKLGVLALTRSFARVLGPYGITVNAVSPGFIDTGGGVQSEFETMASRIPAGRVGTPDDVVGVVRFLLSDEAAYVNGANIHVSGGWGL